MYKFCIELLKILFIFAYFINISYGLRCYTCSYLSSMSDRSCLNDPDKVVGQKITNCNKKYCTIQRQELTDPPGFVNSFLRGCEDSAMNDMIEDPTFKTFYRSCSTELCNKGDGTGTSSGSLSEDGEIGENMLVPGLPNGVFRINTRIPNVLYIFWFWIFIKCLK